MPLQVTIQYARTTRACVDTVTVRWAPGCFVPSRCAPQWVADPTVQAEVAEQVASRRLAAAPDPIDPPGPAPGNKPSAN
jgi:hypothetical protein